MAVVGTVVNCLQLDLSEVGGCPMQLPVVVEFVEASAVVARLKRMAIVAEATTPTAVDLTVQVVMGFVVAMNLMMF